MSRFDLDEPDLDRYADKPVDMADFPKDGQSWQDTVDPVERAAHVLIDAVADLERQLTQVTDLNRAWDIKRQIKRAYEQVDRVDRRASAIIDVLVERRR